MPVYLDGSVQGCTCKLVVVFGVDNDLHHIMGVALEHLTALPFSVPVPQFDQHVVWHLNKDIDY